MNRIPLCVPTWASSEAFKTNAKYDAEYGFYILDSDDDSEVWEWLPKKYKGWKKAVLVPDMLPTTAWADNVRTQVSPDRWNILRRYCYNAAGSRCEVCGDKGSPYLECHEEWSFNEDTGVQKLVKLLALCPLCHKAKHLGYAKRIGVLDEVYDKLKDVNGWDDAKLAKALDLVHERWKRLSMRKWQTDISWLQEYRVR